MKTQKNRRKLEIQKGKRPFCLHGHQTEPVHYEWDRKARVIEELCVTWWN